MPRVRSRQIGKPHERRLTRVERYRDRGVKGYEQRELQQHRKASADRQRGFRHLQLLHLQRTHPRIVDGYTFLLKVLYLILNSLHLRRVTSRLFKRFRLRPSQGKQQRVKEEREDYD